MDRDTRPSRWIAARVHLLIGVLAIIGVPLASTLTRAGGLAFTMFSGSGSYRLRIVALDESGGARRISPTAVAAHARGSIGDVLAGSEDWRFAPSGSLIRRRLEQVADARLRRERSAAASDCGAG